MQPFDILIAYVHANQYIHGATLEKKQQAEGPTMQDEVSRQ